MRVTAFLRGKWSQVAVKKASEYLHHAAECREMATKANQFQREQLLKMAKTWENLAKDREQQLARQERLKVLDKK
jgi:hypothetical protein